jgi:hypothetical protein
MIFQRIGGLLAGYPSAGGVADRELSLPARERVNRALDHAEMRDNDPRPGYLLRFAGLW